MLLQCLPSGEPFLTEPTGREALYRVFSSIKDLEGFMHPAMCTLGMYL